MSHYLHLLGPFVHLWLERTKRLAVDGDLLCLFNVNAVGVLVKVC